ncbi:MAG: hypothetical protein JW947_10710 [Sedimentisphaerales bacterium]|nr:hypothetical protein [Sedimentisphaerales bacterium]
MIMNPTMEPNKIAASLTNVPAVIVRSFVALYMIAIADAKGSSHSIACGFARICSGAVKVAKIKKPATDI